jgi:hypothetical protein
MMQTYQVVQWPAVIKLHADHELIFVADAVQFANDDALQHTHLQAQDILIDSAGTVYSISHNQGLDLVGTGSVLSVSDVEELLRLHLSSKGSCCVAKFHVLSIRESFEHVFV